MSRDSTDFAIKSHNIYKIDAQIVDFMSKNFEFCNHMVEAANFVCLSFRVCFLKGIALNPHW